MREQSYSYRLLSIYSNRSQVSLGQAGLVFSVFFIVWFEFLQENVKVLTIIPSLERGLLAALQRLNEMIKNFQRVCGTMKG